jgi:hypothetical protein
MCVIKFPYTGDLKKVTKGDIPLNINAILQRDRISFINL